MSLLDLTAVELSKEIKAGKVTAVEAMQAVLDKINEREDALNCYVTIDKEKALDEAKRVQKEIEEGRLTGPLAGVPVAIKDNMCTEDMLTTCSSKILSNFVPSFSAEAVNKLKEAGAVIIGKPTWMNLPWVLPQRLLLLELPKILIMRNMYREVHQADRQQR